MVDFKVEKKKNKNASKYEYEELDIALAFAKSAHKEFNEFLKGIVLFGSAAKLTSRQNQKKKGDIDILVILDDIRLQINSEIIEAYKIITAKLVSKTSQRIHITTLKFTTFWDMIRNGDPVAINILRDGLPLIDTGFFEPLQALLHQGQIKPTFESIWTYFNRSTETLNLSKNHLLRATIDLYWATIDAAHAALMKQHCIPTSPEYASHLIQEHLVKKNLCEHKHAETMKFFYRLNKEIEHKIVTEVSGSEFDRYYTRAKLFIEKMKEIVNN